MTGRGRDKTLSVAATSDQGTDKSSVADHTPLGQAYSSWGERQGQAAV